MTENAKYGGDDGQKGTTDRHRCTRKQESESREVVLNKLYFFLFESMQLWKMIKIVDNKMCL